MDHSSSFSSEIICFPKGLYLYNFSTKINNPINGNQCFNHRWARGCLTPPCRGMILICPNALELHSFIMKFSEFLTIFYISREKLYYNQMEAKELKAEISENFSRITSSSNGSTFSLYSPPLPPQIVVVVLRLSFPRKLGRFLLPANCLCRVSRSVVPGKWPSGQ